MARRPLHSRRGSTAFLVAAGRLVGASEIQLDKIRLLRLQEPRQTLITGANLLRLLPPEQHGPAGPVPAFAQSEWVQSR